MNKIRIFVISCMLVIATASSGALADTLGNRETFFVNSEYDLEDRTSVSGTLYLVSDHAYFYVEDTYLDRLNSSERQTFDQRLQSIASDFDTRIYPKETSFWGFEAKPGIDGDPRITIFLERLNPGTGGYFDSVNSYLSSQAPGSNQREMIVANVTSLGTEQLGVFLAHELQHLISFNQKELTQKVFEEVWLNELRSQYAVTIAGYNENFSTADLLQRASVFVRNPTDSVVEWPNTNIDYASVTLFGHYLVEQFGPGIIQETLRSRLAGIASINEYLANHRRSERFGDVFANWVWTSYVNDRNRDSRYGYAHPVLQSLHVSATNNRLLAASAPDTFSYAQKPWQPTWERFITDTLAPRGKNIKISWDSSQYKVYYGDTGTNVRSLRSGDVIAPPGEGSFILMPINESKTERFSGNETASPMTLTVEYVDQAASSTTPSISDGTLIMHAGTPDVYVVTGPYKRYLAPQVLKFYGLDATQAITVSEATFQSYMVSNYIRAVNDKKVYAVWPDTTKHWLNITAQHFTDSHRDWNSIFVVNDLEANFYSTGPDITR